jgi:hypothetical protein
MKRFFFITLCLLLISASAMFAQIPGSIGVFGDSLGTDCNIRDDGGYVTVYILHVMADGVTACVFGLDVSATSWTYIGTDWSFELVLSPSIADISIAYQVCLSSPIYLGRVTFMGSSEPPCTPISIVAAPWVRSGNVEAADCEYNPNRLFPTGGRAVVNGDLTCQCTLPVEATTWGRVKAMYR